MKRIMKSVMLIIAATVILGGGCDSSKTKRKIDGHYDPVIDPANFSTTIDNPFMPLTPGTTMTYAGVGEDGNSSIIYYVTYQTKVVMGVTCVVVNDNAYEEGELVEMTDDWFAQDNAGNVWYFGENSAEIDNGQVESYEGSWEAGVDGAKPGIVMYAESAIIVGIPYRQEYYFNEAEDWGVVISMNGSVTVPAGTYTDCLITKDWNALEPKVIENKYYARGIGVVYEEAVEGESEYAELISITP